MQILYGVHIKRETLQALKKYKKSYKVSYISKAFIIY